MAAEGVSERQEEDGYLDKDPEESHDSQVSGEGKLEVPGSGVALGQREESGFHVC